MNWKKIISFWFEEIEGRQHWVKDSAFDKLIEERFLSTHKAASAGELSSWRQEPEGRLAEIIVLDQFSRNIYRDTPMAFSQDGMALILSQEAILLGADQKVAAERKSFFYMPLMHSESRVVHEEAEKIFSSLSSSDFEKKHKAIIDRFGRYPHRNRILGRTSTPEEVEFLSGPGSSF